MCVCYHNSHFSLSEWFLSFKRTVTMILCSCVPYLCIVLMTFIQKLRRCCQSFHPGPNFDIVFVIGKSRPRYRWLCLLMFCLPGWFGGPSRHGYFDSFSLSTFDLFLALTLVWGWSKSGWTWPCFLLCLAPERFWWLVLAQILSASSLLTPFRYIEKLDSGSQGHGADDHFLLYALFKLFE